MLKSKPRIITSQSYYPLNWSCWATKYVQSTGNLPRTLRLRNNFYTFCPVVHNARELAEVFNLVCQLLGLDTVLESLVTFLFLHFTTRSWCYCCHIRKNHRSHQVPLQFHLHSFSNWNIYALYADQYTYWSIQMNFQRLF